MSTLLDDLRNIVRRLRRVKTGDLILADDHNSLVDYAEKSLSILDDHDNRIAALEKQPPFPSASGIDPWTAIVKSPELQDMLLKNIMYGTWFIDVPVFLDDFPASTYTSADWGAVWFDYFISSQRIGKSTTYLELQDVKWLPARTRKYFAWASADGDTKYTLIIAMIRPRAMQPATEPYVLAAMVNCWPAERFFDIIVDTDGVIKVYNPVTNIDNTGVVFKDWLILAIGTYPTPSGNGRVMILDRNLNVLYTRDADFFDPLCSSGVALYIAHVLDPATDPPTAMTLEIDWIILQSWAW